MQPPAVLLPWVQGRSCGLPTSAWPLLPTKAAEAEQRDRTRGGLDWAPSSAWALPMRGIQRLWMEGDRGKQPRLPQQERVVLGPRVTGTLLPWDQTPIPGRAENELPGGDTAVRQ